MKVLPSVSTDRCFYSDGNPILLSIPPRTHKVFPKALEFRILICGLLGLISVSPLYYFCGKINSYDDDDDDRYRNQNDRSESADKLLIGEYSAAQKARQTITK